MEAYQDIEVFGKITAEEIQIGAYTLPKVDGSNLQVLSTDGSGNVTWKSATSLGLTTSGIPEGSNLYFTNERVDDRVSLLIQNGTGLSWSYNDGLNQLTGTVTLAPFSTSNLVEGSRLYFTNERVDDRVASLIQNGTGITWSYNDALNQLTGTVSLAPFSTSNLAEGSNLYYTSERAQDDVAGMIQDGTGISWSYNDLGNTLWPTINLSDFTSDDLPEGVTNLYATDERIDDRVAALVQDTASVTWSYNDGLGTLEATAFSVLDVQKAGALISSQGAINLIEGTGIGISVVNDGANNRANITISATATGTVNSVYSDGIQVGDSDITALYFSNKFSVIEPVDTRILIDLEQGSITEDYLSIIGSPQSGSLGEVLRSDGLGNFYWSPIIGESYQTKTIWVDQTYGDDLTGTVDRMDLPFSTIGAALTAAGALAFSVKIMVNPGSYAEEGLVIPTGVSMESTGGTGLTSIGLGPSLATQNVIEMGEESSLIGFELKVPQAFFAAIFDDTSGGCTCKDIMFYGNGENFTSSGIGYLKSGSGKSHVSGVGISRGGIQIVAGSVNGMLDISDLQIEEDMVGSILSILYADTDKGTGAVGKIHSHSLHSHSSNVTVVSRLEGGTQTSPSLIPEIILDSPYVKNAGIFISADGDAGIVRSLGGDVQDLQLYTVGVDPSGSGLGFKVVITSSHASTYSYPPAVVANAEFLLSYSEEVVPGEDSAFNIFGANKLSVGFPERGSRSYTGKGSPYTAGMIVLTTNDTAGTSSDGANFIDVTAEATSNSGSTFSFQGPDDNHTILWGSTRLDGSSVPLKHWGLEAIIDTGNPNFEYQIEIWDGSNWTSVGNHSVSKEESWSYADTLLYRSSSREVIRVGIDQTTTWATKTINGTLAYWMRMRITSGIKVGSLPEIQQIKLLESSFNVSANGVPSQTGLAQFRKTIPLFGPVWTGDAGGGATLQDHSVTVGDTSIGGNNWTHRLRTSLTSGTGDAFMIQIPIPIGTCTAFPLKLSMAYEFEGATGASVISAANPNQMTMLAVPKTISGNWIADKTGSSLIPVKREFSENSELSTTTPPVKSTIDLVPEGAIPGTTTYSLVDNMVHYATFGDIDITSIYESDMLIVRLQFEQQDAAADIAIWSLLLEGVAHQGGAGI